MHPLVYHCASGQAFFTGCGLVLVGVALPAVRPTPRMRSIATALSCLGVAGVVGSATPASHVWYVAAGVCWAAWLVLERGALASRPVFRTVARSALCAAAVVGMLFELPYHFSPWISPLGERPLHVIGDSLTAGMGEAETWPQLFAAKRPSGTQTVSHARAGATAGSALQQAKALNAKLGAAEGMILIEIGGNDLLGTTTAAGFERDLEALLVQLAAPGRTLVMLELPLYPTANEFGRIQRQAAARHGALLVPKRVMLDVIDSEESTLDAIHLSPAGRKLMAESMWRLLGGG
jgi:acyl-CoA thioesterase-1